MNGKWLRGLIVCLLALVGTAGTALADDAYAETPLYDASDGQRNNILLAAQAIDGVRLDFGDGFSFNEIVGVRSAERGFQNAENGRGVTVTGGGVAQTATTLYLALMQRDDIEYSSIYTYNERFTGGYVDSGYDAIATDYANGLDFAFNSYHEGTMVIYMWVDDNSLCCYVTEDGGVGAGTRVGSSELPTESLGAQASNIRLAAESISGWTLQSGETFSFNEIVGPRGAEYGYLPALNGRGAKVTGGGVAQAAAAVYMAVRELDCVEITEMQVYGGSYAGSYVSSGEDAVLVDYAGDVDFAFTYLGKDELSVYVYLNGNRLVCEIYED